MRILFINPAIRPDSPRKFVPVGLLYVMSAAHRAGYQFDLLDIDAHRPDPAEVERFVRTNHYDVVAFGCMVTAYRWVRHMAELVKSANPAAKVIVGNSVASSVPEILLQKTEVDVAAIGEGDETIVELLRCIEKGDPLDSVAGIYYRRKDGHLVRTPLRPVIADIDAIPLPEFDLLDIEVYLAASRHNIDRPSPLPLDEVRALPVNTARGCPFQCTFCYHVFKGERYRHTSPRAAVARIADLKRRYGINYVQFWDELTFFSRKQANAFADALLEANLGIYFTAPIRATLLKEEDRDLAHKLKRAGCEGLSYSLESTNVKILEAMNKRIKPEDFARQKRILDGVGIITWTALVFGYPQETVRTINETLEFCLANGVYPSVGFLEPMPCTPMYELAIERGLIPDEEAYLMELGDRQDLHINLTAMPDQEMVRAVEDGLARINRELGIGLGEGELVKTGSHRGKLPSFS